MRWAAWWTVALDLVAAGALVLAFARSGGHWWYRQVALRARFNRRRKARPSRVDPGDPRLTYLDRVGGPVRVRTVEHRRIQVGIAEDAAGWFAVIELAPGADLRADAAPPVSIAVLAKLLGDRTIPCLVQAVTRTVPAPTALLPGGVPAVASYQLLLEGRPVVAAQTTWIALRIDIPPASSPGVEYGNARAAEVALAGVAERAGRTLAAAGLPCRVLDGDGLAAVLPHASGLPALAGETREHWSGWHSGTMAHVCYAVHAWRPRTAAASQLLPQLAAAPAAATTVAVTLAHGPTGHRLRCLVRLCAPATAIAAADEHLTAVARREGLQLRRLDGRHGPAAYASMPTGGGWPGDGYPGGVGPASGHPDDVDWLPGPAAGSPFDVVAPASSSGVVLGRDTDGSPVPIRFFRAVPTEVVVAGGGWAARLLVVRAIALGALVFVRTAYPNEWVGLGEAISGRNDRLVLLGRGPLPPVAAMDHQPVLFVDDFDAGAIPDRPPLGPWQSRLTVLRRFTASGFPAVADAQVVVLQRLAPVEASDATSALRLAGETPHLLQVMHDDMFALIGGGVNQYVWTNPTRWELDHLGPPRRDPA